MIVHIFTQVSDYSTEFLKMLTENFNPQEHEIIFRKESDVTETLKRFHDLKIRFLGTRQGLLKHMPDLLHRSQRIIFHSFPVSRSLIFWLNYRHYMNKAIWSVWGQDAYWYKYCTKTPANRIYELIRKHLIKKLGYVLCPVYGDYEYIKLHYKTSADYIDAMYPIPTNFDVLKKLRVLGRNHENINIQIGNSANPTNNTLEILDYLKKNWRDNYRIFCPLSYGDNTYAKKVSDYGKQLFGENFIPMMKFLKKAEYAEFIAKIDILIMNHQRQQGLGNILSYLYMGKKVYIRNDNSSFNFFEKKGIKVYSTNDLLNNRKTFDRSESDEKINIDNMTRTEHIVEIATIVKNWERILV